jgi:hypothetical protein
MISIEDLNEGQGKDFAAYVEEIMKENEPKRHLFYAKTVEHAEDMGVHVEGDLPKKLLEENRPNEPIDVRKYRISVWKAITESLTDKIFNTLAKIFNPKGFILELPENPGKVKEEESLARYLNTEYGVFRSIWIFARETLLKMLLSDPNSVLLVIPENLDTEIDGEFFRPLPVIFRSKYVVDFEDDKYFTIFIPELKKGSAKQQTESKRAHPGLLMVITTKVIHSWKIKNRELVNGHTFDLTTVMEEGFMPAFRLGGKITGDKSPYWFKSFISGVQPHWDKVVNWVSDCDGAIVNHLHPEKYELQEDCTKCKGKRKITIKDKEIVCPQC